jgi:hypothetical protein
LGEGNSWLVESFAPRLSSRYCWPVVTTAGGGQVAVICNESSSTSFMSYVGQ